MQGKNIIKFFLVLLVAVCLIQYLLIIPTNREEKRANAYAKTQAAAATSEDEAYNLEKAARTAYLDSISSEVVLRIPLIKEYTYEELKGQQLALGLDLKGGYSVILQVDLKDFLLALSENSKNINFQTALEAAAERQKKSPTDFITLFGEEYRKLDGAEPLANIFIRNASLKEKINYESTDAEVLRNIREIANETVDLTFKRLKDRIDKFGVTQPNVSLDANRDLIIVELPGIDNQERAKRFLQASAKLEFWETYRVSDAGILTAFQEADRLLASTNTQDTTAVTEEKEVRIDTIYKPVTDSLGNVVDSTMEFVEVPVGEDPLSAGGPLLSNLTLNSGGQAGLMAPPAVMGFAERNRMKLINDYLAKPEIQRLFPNDLVFRWSAKPTKDIETGKFTSQYELYALRKKRGGDGPSLEGDRVTNASAQPDPVSNQVTVSLKMDNAGARIWNDLTTRAANDNNREVAIVLDDEVVSAPRVNSPIPSGDSQIQGTFTIQEAKDLANILQIGKLPAKTVIKQSAFVGPSLGQENINKSVMALGVGFVLLLIFMIIYYSSGGIISIIALLANVFFIFGVLASYGTVLTLPGIAGIVLTIGMAVDANVIIFERIKEELQEGKSLINAITDGFRHSYSAIIDANVTTLLTAIVLAYFGLGPIKGFAVVLIIGILCTLFTAVLISRLILEWWTVTKGKSISFSTNFSEKLFKNNHIDFLSKRKTFYVVSCVIILMGVVSFFTRGFELGVDFKGGYSYNVTFDPSANVNPQELRTALAGTFGSEPVVKAVDTRNTFNVTTSYLINQEGDEIEEQVLGKLYDGVKTVAESGLTLEAFKQPDSNGTKVTSSSKVGATIAEDIKSSSVYATIFSILLIFIYIFIRFSKWQYSLGSVVGLVHDVLILMSIFTLLHGIMPFTMEIDQAFIAALLTVVGYSMNDTVIVFDRIREYLGTYSNRNRKEVVNMALNMTLNRTIITSATTILVILVLLIFGGSSIKGFAFALFIGIIVGTYSSIFVATPIMYDFSKNDDIKPLAKETKAKVTTA